jgi:hypothetical protein
MKKKFRIVEYDGRYIVEYRPDNIFAHIFRDWYFARSFADLASAEWWVNRELNPPEKTVIKEY